MIKLNYKRKSSETQSNPSIISFEKNIPSKELLEDLDFQVYQHQEPRKKHQTIMASTNNEKFEYFGKQLNNQSGSKYLIGVLSDKKGQMDLYDVDNTYSLTQLLKSDKGVGSIESNVGKSDKNIWELKQSLVANLGTKKAQRKVAKMQSNMIEEEKISQKAEMAEFLKEKSTKLQQQVESQMEESKKQEEDQKREFLPEFDTNAADPSKIYDINSIITREEFENIKCEQIMIALKKEQKTKKKEEVQGLVKFMGEYTRNLILNFDDNFSEIKKYKASTSYILKYIIYLDLLLKFVPKKTITKASMEEVAKEAKVDLIYTKNILSKFYQATPQPENKVLYVRSQMLQDKFICHILVLALTMFGFKFDCSRLIKALRIDQKKIISYAKECGCSVSVKENKSKKPNAPLHTVQLSLTTPFKLQPAKKPMKDKK